MSERDPKYDERAREIATCNCQEVYCLQMREKIAAALQQVERETATRCAEIASGAGAHSVAAEIRAAFPEVK